MPYNTKQAATAIGASAPAIRNYTAQYARYLSTEATPAKGQPRLFTEEDLRVLAYVYQQTSAGATHQQVADQLATGELEAFDWQPPTAAQDATEPQDSAHTALIPVERLQAAITLLQDAQRREEEAKEEAAAMRERIEALQRELGQAQGELNAYRALQPKRPKWWSWLFGG